MQTSRSRNSFPLNPVFNIGKFGNGLVGAPSIAFANSLTTGFFRDAADAIGVAIAGTERGLWDATGLTLVSSGISAFRMGATVAAPDVFITRDAANIPAIRNGTAAQGIRLYNTYTDSSNGEWLSLDWTTTANTLTIAPRANGSGTLRALSIYSSTSQMILGVSGNSARLTLQNAQLLSTVSAIIMSGTAIPAGGTAAAGYRFSSTTNFGMFFGSGAPSLAAAKGSIYLRSDGSGIADRMYVNTDGSTAWTAVATAS